MGLPTNALATYEAIGNREDLSDIIYRIDPTDCPFMTAAEREKATAVNHEWQRQSLASVNTSNAVLEGDDAVTTAVTVTVRLGNIAQISSKTARVTGTQQVVQHAGRDEADADRGGPDRQQHGREQLLDPRHAGRPVERPLHQHAERGARDQQPHDAGRLRI